MEIISQNILENASQIVAGRVHKTPLLNCSSINALANADLWFKCENLQKTGAFKMRGASYAIHCLSAQEREKGVITHSSGNHGAALAYAAKKAGIKCYVITPHNAPKVKIEALNIFGAQVTFSEATLQSRLQQMEKVQQVTGATFIPPYDSDTIIAGQATAAMEIFNAQQQWDFIVTPVGGGGLLSGTALAAHYFAPHTKVIGAEPELAKDAYLSLKKGVLQEPLPPKTIADGLRTGLSQRTFNYINSYVEQIITVSEEEIAAAMQLIWRRMKLIVEPSSAVPLAAILKNRTQFEGRKTALIISGGNVDFSTALSLFN